MLRKRYNYISSIARKDLIFLRTHRTMLLANNQLDYNIKKKRLTRLYYKYKFYNKERRFKNTGLSGLHVFLFLHGCGPKPHVIEQPVDLGDEFGVKLENTYTMKFGFEDTGSLMNVSDVLTNLMLKEVNEEFEKVSNNKD